MATVSQHDWESAGLVCPDLPPPSASSSREARKPNHAALKSLFNQYDEQLEGYLTASQLQELFNTLRDLDDITGTALSVEQAKATIDVCCAADTCEFREMIACLRELDRRLDILRNVRWEFDMLDLERRGLLTVEQTHFLFQATHNERFSEQQFTNFIHSRPRLNSAISFEEIELEICKIPTIQQVLFEAAEAKRKEAARVEKAKLQATHRQAEEERRQMSLRIAALARLENDRRDQEARKTARLVALKKDEEDRVTQEVREKELKSRFRKRKMTIDLHREQRQAATQARERRSQLQSEIRAQTLREEEEKELAKLQAEEKAKEEAEQQRMAKKALEEEEERRRLAEAQQQAEKEAQARAEEERKRKQEEERQLAEQQAREDELARQKVDEEVQNAAQREAEALAEAKAAAAALAGAKDEQSKAEALQRQKQAKKKARLEREKRVRGNLKVATKSRKIEQLEPAVNEAIAIKPEKEDWPELSEAQKLLQQLKAAIELKGAITGRKLEMLQAAVGKVRKSGCEEGLHKEMLEAKALISKLEKLARQKKEIMDMKAGVISELRSYSKPPVAVHKVLIATFLLLGVKEKDTKTWSSIQALMGKTGKESLKRRVSECEPHLITVDTVQRVRHQLQGLDVLGVSDISATAGTFAFWVETMVEEAETHFKR
ncbi:calponin homology domain-containing protein DDB_G0272472-like [Sycon ciliatum]|uniref:calponin homology domain-containing protein DDB_G0272472-like n=1 Tax=Sycon ciliatum TaxID=27933 RepID=UPI0031F65E42